MVKHFHKIAIVLVDVAVFVACVYVDIVDADDVDGDVIVAVVVSLDVDSMFLLQFQNETFDRRDLLLVFSPDLISLFLADEKIELTTW